MYRRIFLNAKKHRLRKHIKHFLDKNQDNSKSNINNIKMSNYKTQIKYINDKLMIKNK
jgi:hypothetical protein